MRQHFVYVAIWCRVLSCKNFHRYDTATENIGRTRRMRAKKRLSRILYWLSDPWCNALTDIMFQLPYEQTLEKFWKRIAKFKKDKEKVMRVYQHVKILRKHIYLSISLCIKSFLACMNIMIVGKNNYLNVSK